MDTVSTTNNASSRDTATAVLVVGGALVGLSAALFLAWQGVPTILVERHAGSSPHPRAIGYTPRTLELLRAVGLADRVPQVDPSFRLRRARVASLAGERFEETPWTPSRDSGVIEQSPCTGAAIAQDRLEPLLRDRAVELGADVRMETELVRFEQDDRGVTAWLRERSGREYTVRASYLVAADGHRSPVRTALGIGRSGRGLIRTVRSVLFRAPLDEYLREGVSQFSIDQPGFNAFLTTYGDGRWVLIFSDDEERDEATLHALIAKAIGRDDVPVEIVTTGRWEMSALIADRFAVARVFLAGDAAHTLPPSRGGFGANTGIEDVHNLAWKLAAVIAKKSEPALLDSYDAERRPVAWLRHDQIFARDDYKAVAAGIARDVEILDDDAMEFGQLYRSNAIVGAGSELPPAKRPEQWAGQPGTRAPHVWVVANGERVSLLDLLPRRWTLVAGDDAWRAAARSGDVSCVCIDVDLRDASNTSIRTALGVGDHGAALIRPDGYIAWRITELPVDATKSLAAAFLTVRSARAH